MIMGFHISQFEFSECQGDGDPFSHNLQNT